MFTEKLERVRSALIKSEPWLSGTLDDAPDHFLKIFYVDRDDPAKPHLVTLSKDASTAALQHLSDTCDPASFGRGGESVMDESYRKAGKLDKKSFAPLFDMDEARILPKVATNLLRGLDAEKPIIAELYKLNVYGEGSFFRPHKDTPRSDKMFGSIVIVFPTPHQGGSLALRHNGNEFVFSSDREKVSYVAFFSDVEHEVLPVTEGYRVTLTYNLYYGSSLVQSSLSTSLIDEVTTLRRALSTLLEEPTFLPEGGILGFGLNYAYPVDVGIETTDLAKLLMHLKGSDEVIKIACTELGLRISLKAIVIDDADSWGRPHQPRYVMISRLIPAMNDAQVEDLLDFLLDLGGQLIHSIDDDPPKVYDEEVYSHEGMETRSKEVAWITPLTEYSTLRSEYLAYGNEPSVSHLYMDLCLMASIGPAGDRENVNAYKGVKLRTGTVEDEDEDEYWESDDDDEEEGDEDADEDEE